MKVVILAGGLGTRLGSLTRKVPKPMIDLVGLPLIIHVMQIYADQGIKDFIIAAGYKGAMIAQYMKSFDARGWKISVIDTGLDTKTGGRIRRAIMDADLSDPFMITYGDGLADINLRMLVDHHLRMKKEYDVLVTLTASNPPSRFGRLDIANGLCEIFTEKGQHPDGWINSGFYVVEPRVVNLIAGDQSVWEKDILPALSYQRRLAAYQHPGEFQMIDTPRDLEYVQNLIKTGRLFWRSSG